MTDVPPGLEPLPAHRVALRVATTAPLAGFLAALAGVIAVLIAEGRGPQHLAMAVGALALATVGLTTWCALLAVSEQVALRARPLLRAPMIAAVGAGAFVFAFCAAVWAKAIYDGKGADGALAALAGVLERLLADWDKTAQAGLFTLVPFVALGATRTLVARARGAGWSAVLAAAGTCAAFVLACAFHGLPSRNEREVIFALCTLPPLAGGAGLALGERVERRVLAAWAAWRESARDG